MSVISNCDRTERPIMRPETNITGLKLDCRRGMPGDTIDFSEYVMREGVRGISTKKAMAQIWKWSAISVNPDEQL